MAIKEFDKETSKKLDSVKLDLRSLAALAIEESDPIAFNHHLREILNTANGSGVAVDWQTLRAAYDAEKGLPQNKPKPAAPSQPTPKTDKNAPKSVNTSNI